MYPLFTFFDSLLVKNVINVRNVLLQNIHFLIRYQTVLWCNIVSFIVLSQS